MVEAMLGVVVEVAFSKALSFTTEEISRALAVRENLEALFAYEILRKKTVKGNKQEKVRNFFSSSHPVVFRFEMANKIKNINLRMEEIFQTSTWIELRPTEIMNLPTYYLRSKRLTASFVDDSKIMGREGDIENLMSQLLVEYSNDFSVIGIVGMASLGTTSVAQLLMKNDLVKKKFEKMIWTCVFEEFQVNRILNDMFQSLIRKDCNLKNREAIVNDLKEEIGGKTYLLVLDDVWNEAAEL
ncbi:hypothetical protein M9H77_19010 [Catharanthus roseus]|uniref:Uncharacterized protein n=1 Tax=Catharanthus roseus TaxID=4058 RepID=A0ACC0B973_CATRO|nr:hypothetical protein M9H77_19010 [Catharanthus roseus]